MKQNDNLLDIITVLWNNRRYIIISTVVAIIIAVIGSLLMDNYYKASTSFYAASPDLALPATVGAVENKQEYYGTDTDLDRLFSLANSSLISDYLISKYKLYEHYDIDSTHQKAKSKILKKFRSLFNTQKTKYDALEMSIEDKDRELAAIMVNDARNKLNTLAQSIVKETQAQLINKYKANIDEKQIIMNKLSDSLQVTRTKYGVYNTSSQSEILTTQLVKSSSMLNDYKARLTVLKDDPIYRDSLSMIKARISGAEKQLAATQKKMDLFNSGLAKIVNLELEQREFAEQLSLDKERYKQLKGAYQSSFSALHVVERANTPVEKSRPKRSLYVIGAAMLAFIISSLMILFLHSFKGIKEAIQNA